jgi:hypothetical protein
MIHLPFPGLDAHTWMAVFSLPGLHFPAVQGKRI